MAKKTGKFNKLARGETQEKEHTAQAQYTELHKSKEASDGGACLLHCMSKHDVNSCSYRWQACCRVEEESRRAEKERKAKVYGETWRPGWFENGSEPWPNAAHHLLPVGQLLSVIGDLGKINPNIVALIIQDLLERKYNINHRVNMMILPQEAEQSHELGLPTHPSFQSQGYKKGEGKSKFIFHVRYSAKIKQEVAAILSPYEKLAKEGCRAGKKTIHGIIKELNALSKRLYDSIISDRAEFKKRHPKSADAFSRTLDDEQSLAVLFPDSVTKSP